MFPSGSHLARSPERYILPSPNGFLTNFSAVSSGLLKYSLAKPIPAMHSSPGTPIPQRLSFSPTIYTFVLYIGFPIVSFSVSSVTSTLDVFTVTSVGPYVFITRFPALHHFLSVSRLPASPLESSSLSVGTFSGSSALIYAGVIDVTVTPSDSIYSLSFSGSLTVSSGITAMAFPFHTMLNISHTDWSKQ